MSRVPLAGLALLLLSLAPRAPAQSPVERLTNAEVDEALAVLKAKAALSAGLSEADLKRATLQGLLDRLAPQGALLPAGAAPPAPAVPFHSEVLEGKIGYLRPGALTKEQLAALDTALAGFAEKGLAAQVLDLRALPPGLELEPCAALCQRWAPKGQALFTVTRREEPRTQLFTAKADPAAHGLLLILTSAENAGSAEVIAATLRGTARALVIGQKTKGEAGEFAEKPLGAGTVLRFPVGEVTLPWPEWLGNGVWPDLPVEVNAETAAAVLKAESGSVAPLLLETERPRLNEAALVAGKNPELDALEAAQREHLTVKPPLRDAVLARAVDVVTSVGILGRK